MKKGWLEGCRRIIGLDGCFLKGMCKGQLLVAVSKDGNNQMFPIAWAIVEVENTHNWEWFLRCVIQDLNLGDGQQLTMMSDMQKGLTIAVKNLLPEAEHRMCARHVLANWSKNWRGLERRNCFWKIARSSCIVVMNKNMAELDQLGYKICESLLCYRKEGWCRAYFNAGVECDVIDNNMCETFNAWILEARHKTVITMLEEIRVKMMKRVSKLREFGLGWKEDISHIAMKVLGDNVEHSMKCDLRWNGDKGYEVVDDKFTHTVNFTDLTCSCRAWNLKGIPCAHAITAMHHRNEDPKVYVSKWYRRDTYLKAYSTFIQPMNNMAMWPSTNNPPVEPPLIRKMPGRPQKKRRREETEHPKSGKLSRKGQEVSCSNCKEYGHNKRGCPRVPRTDSATGVPSSSNGRGRGAGRGSGRGTNVSEGGRGAGRGAGRGDGRGRNGIGLFQASNGFTSFASGSGNARVIDTGGLTSSDSVKECAFKPEKRGMRWNGSPAITKEALQRAASSQPNPSQGSST